MKKNLNNETVATKKELIETLSNELDTSKVDTKQILKGFVNVILKLTSENSILRIPGLGSFRVQKTPERVGRNPRTGEEVVIEKSSRVSFRAAKEFKRITNNVK